MPTLKDFTNRNPHDPILEGDNLSYMAMGHYPRAALEKILPSAFSIPSDEVMAKEYPTLKTTEGMHPCLMMFSTCTKVHDLMTNWELPNYKELMFFFPAMYTHGNETQLCSYVPVLYLDYFMGVIGGMYVGLRKQYRPSMTLTETETSRSYVIKDVLDVSFEQTSPKSTPELDPFFAKTFENPTATVSYLGRTFFYTTKVHPAKVVEASSTFTWNYKGSVVTSDEHTLANYSEYTFTVSHAMGYQKYFHPKTRVALSPSHE